MGWEELVLLLLGRAEGLLVQGGAGAESALRRVLLLRRGVKAGMARVLVEAAVEVEVGVGVGCGLKSV